MMPGREGSGGGGRGGSIHNLENLHLHSSGHRSTTNSSYPRRRRHHHHVPVSASSASSRSYPQLPVNEELDNGENDIIACMIDLISGLVVMALSILCLTGLLTLLTILYLLVRPFSESAYRRLAAQLGAASFLDAMSILMPNMTIYLTGDSDVPSPVGTSLLVCNHLMEGDWWAILMLGRCVGLRGSVKVFLRKELLPQKTASATGTDGAGTNNRPNDSRMPSPASAPSLVGGGGGTAVLVRSTSYGSTGQLIGAPPGIVVPPSATSAYVCGGAGTSTAATGGGSGSGGGGMHHNTSFPILHNLSSCGNKSTIVSPPISLAGKLLHVLLEFPILTSENNKDYIADREDLFTLLRSFAASGGPAPVHLLLFPESWSLQCANDGTDRRAVMARSVEFAKREGRPQLKHLLLPRTTGFNACLESLRESSPVVYDVTMAYRGYDGSVPIAMDLSIPTLWRLIRGHIPSEVHIRIKRYSMEEVLQDACWLDKQWAEKDRLLGHFSRHQSFPLDNRGFCRYRAFETRTFGLETSLVGLIRLGLLPFAIPFILLVSIPLFWVVLWIWLAYRAFNTIFPEWGRKLMGVDGQTLGNMMPNGSGGAILSVSRQTSDDDDDGGNDEGGIYSVDGTPFFPATPFGSPSLTTWSYEEGDSPGRR